MAVDASGAVTLKVMVDYSAGPGSTIINDANIDSDQTNPTTVQADTFVCENRPPVVFCNADAPITPPDATISFTATAEDNCSAAVQITDYDCYKYNSRRIDTASSMTICREGFSVSKLKASPPV